MRNVKQLFLRVFYETYFNIKYYKVSFIMQVFAFPLVLLILDLLHGSFIGTVKFFNKEVNYFLFFSIVTVSYYFIESLISGTLEMFWRSDVSMFKSKNVLIYLISKAVNYDLLFSYSSLLFTTLFIYLFIKVYVLKFLILALISSILSTLVATPLSIFLFAMSLILRGRDAEDFLYFIRLLIVWGAMPIYFTFFYFIPENYHLLLALVPITSLSEVLRYIFFIGITPKIVSLSILTLTSSLIYFIISLKLFKYALYKSRKSGKIFLQ